MRERRHKREQRRGRKRKGQGKEREKTGRERKDDRKGGRERGEEKGMRGEGRRELAQKWTDIFVFRWSKPGKAGPWLGRGKGTKTIGDRVL